jgi:hypothetical protein
MLREQGVTCSRLPPAEKSFEAEIAASEHYLFQICGLTEDTRTDYLCVVRRFLRRHVRSRRVGFSKFRPQEVRDLVGDCRLRRKAISMRSVAVGLRSYFRFQALDGVRVEPLIQAIPRIILWRLSGLPRTLTAQEIQPSPICSSNLAWLEVSRLASSTTSIEFVARSHNSFTSRVAP